MAQESESRSLDKVIVRLPDGMRDRIKAAAEANNRSMNAEIVAVLEREYPAFSLPESILKAIEAIDDALAFAAPETVQALERLRNDYERILQEIGPPRMSSIPD